MNNHEINFNEISNLPSKSNNGLKSFAQKLYSKPKACSVEHNVISNSDKQTSDNAVKGDSVKADKGDSVKRKKMLEILTTIVGIV